MQFNWRISMILVFFGLSQGACAHSLTGLRAGTDLKAIEVSEVVSQIPPGSLLVIGENHGQAEDQSQQLQILRALRSAGHQVSVGLEFFSYPFQGEVEAWRSGQLSESDFLKKIGWGQPSFDFYRAQAEFPELGEGLTVALNAPRELTSKISKTGLGSLTEGDRRFLPPQFSLGRDTYRERFAAVMAPHLPDPSAIDRYFAAQSVWDDTMAWRACEAMQKKAGQTLVIVVGEFHVQYGGGLPNRLRARCPQILLRTLSQVDLTHSTAEESERELRPSPEEGPRADWIWVESRVLAR